MYKNPSLTQHSHKNVKASLDEKLYFTQHQTIPHSTPAAPRNNGYAAAGKLNLKDSGISEPPYFRQAR